MTKVLYLFLQTAALAFIASADLAKTTEPNGDILVTTGEHLMLGDALECPRKEECSPPGCDANATCPDPECPYIGCPDINSCPMERRRSRMHYRFPFSRWRYEYERNKDCERHVEHCQREKDANCADHKRAVDHCQHSLYDCRARTASFERCTSNRTPHCATVLA